MRRLAAQVVSVLGSSLLIGASFFVLPVTAQVCPVTDPSGAVSCSPVTWCGGTCQAEPTNCTGEKSKIGCGACNCVCPDAFPNDCTATNSKCQSNNTSCATQNRQTTCNTGGGANQLSCGACVSGYTDCSGTCVSSTSPSCLSPKQYNACTGACVDPYVNISPSSAQSGSINVTGNITSGGNLTVAGNITTGDIFMANNKAIRVDDSGVTNAKFKNYSGTGLHLGINEDSPSYALDVATDGSSAIARLNGGTSQWAGLSIATGGTQKWYAGMDNGGQYLISKGPAGGPTTYPLIIDTSGKVIVNTLKIGSSATSGQVLTADVSGNATWQTPSAGISGTVNRVPKFATTTSLGDSQIFDDGSNIGIGTAPLAPSMLTVNGSINPIAGYGDLSASTGSVRFAGNGGSPNAGGISFGDNTGWKFHIGTSASSVFAPRVTFQDNGNVGIGTTSPAVRFAVSNAGNEGIELVPAIVPGVDLIQAFKRSEGIHDSLRFDAADYRFTIAGTEKVRIDPDGSVGIGTSGPATQLHVYNSSSGPVISLSGQTNNYRGLSIKNTTNNENWFVGSNDASNKFVIRKDGNTNPFTINNDGTITLYANDTSTLPALTAGKNLIWANITSSAAGNFLNLQNGGTDKFKVTVDGQVQVPYGSSALPSFSSVGNTTTGLYFPNTNNVAFSTAGTERVRVGASGNVGIGDSSPAALFTVGDGDKFRVDNLGRVQADWGDALAGSLSYSFVGDTDTGIYSPATNKLTFRTFNVDRMSIDETGNVGIGTSSPNAGARLHVYKSGANAEVDIQSGGIVGDNSHWGLYANKYTGLSDNSFNIWGGGSNRLTILTTGNIGIGVVNPGAKLEVAGQIKITGGTPGLGKALTSDATGLATWGTVNSCSSGRKFVGLTTTPYNGARGGYTGLASICSEYDVPGGYEASVCSVEEIMNSIQCNVTLPTDGSDGWISAGPPGNLAAVRDCYGWTSSSNSEFGRYWRFVANGGRGAVGTCNQEIKFACCR